MSNIITLNDVSYFDYRCDELHLRRKYLHYLPPSQLNIILLLFHCKTKREICSELKRISTSHFEMTLSRLDTAINDIRRKLYNLQYHAEVFGISESIQAAPLDDLKKIVLKYIEEIKNDERTSD